MICKIITIACIIAILIGALLRLVYNNYQTGVLLIFIGVAVMIIRGFFTENKEYEL